MYFKNSDTVYLRDQEDRQASLDVYFFLAIMSNRLTASCFLYFYSEMFYLLTLMIKLHSYQ